MNITLSQFRYFCTLAEIGHFGRAAERLHISQPPLSRQIALLEAELGTTLFKRHAKGVSLTPAGRQFLEDAQAVLRQVEQARRNASSAGTGEVGHLKLGFTMCAAYNVVPSLARRYTEAFPRVDFQAREVLPGEIPQALRDGGIDLAISFPSPEPQPFTAMPLLREPLSLVLPQHHPLARARRVRVEALAHERFLIVPRPQAPLLHDAIVERCRQAGFSPMIALEVYLQQTIVNFVAEGLGVALVPASMARAEVKGTVFKSLFDPPMIEQQLFWSHENRNPCIQRFLSLARAEPDMVNNG
ncbi:MAG TPA: LysR substrate-binding domain-containing protein [Stellaceae bacterium]|nr:LysR substrate-binding domain-containing protein [Stellaceae bacterium]